MAQIKQQHVCAHAAIVCYYNVWCASVACTTPIVHRQMQMQYPDAISVLFETVSKFSLLN